MLSDNPATDASPTRMIAAIVPRESQAWFVKITGPEEAMATAADDIRAFIGAMRLPTDDPNAVAWTVPAEWQDGGERMMREATLLLPVGDPPLEVAISKLGYDGDQQPYLLANINRWRGQLGLPPLPTVDEMDDVAQVKLAGGDAWVFDAVGSMGGGMQPPMRGGNAPFAGAMPPTNSMPKAVPKARTAKPEIKFATPDNWQQLARGTMGSRSYQFGDASDPVVVKLSDFPPVGSMADPLANINRWRGQLGQPPLDEDSIKQHTEAVVVSDVDGVLASMEHPDQSTAMLAAMVVKLDQVWFFQMTGTPAGVAAHRDEFINWLGTVEIVLPGATKEDE